MEFIKKSHWLPREQAPSPRKVWGTGEALLHPISLPLQQLRCGTVGHCSSAITNKYIKQLETSCAGRELGQAQEGQKEGRAFPEVVILLSHSQPPVTHPWILLMGSRMKWRGKAILQYHLDRRTFTLLGKEL